MKGRGTTVKAGDTFHRWSVVSPADPDASGRRRWFCTCVCGREGRALEDNLKRGGTKSCGCLSSDTVKERNRTHGLSNEPMYTVWNAVMQRCHNPNSPTYKDYGARGITVHPAWHDYLVFRLEVPKKIPGMTFDRENNDKGYEPGNVRWVSQKEQMLNRRCSVRVSINGVKDLVALSETIGVPYGTTSSRFRTLQRLGLPVEELISAPRVDYTRATRSARKQRKLTTTPRKVPA